MTHCKKSSKCTFLTQQWSQEEISQHIKFENNASNISYSAIYRGIMQAF